MPAEEMAEYVRLMEEYPAAVARREKAGGELATRDDSETRSSYLKAATDVERIEARLKEIYPE
jgi:hypothetical protein